MPGEMTHKHQPRITSRWSGNLRRRLEGQAIAAAAQECGCDCVQGFYRCRPKRAVLAMIEHGVKPSIMFLDYPVKLTYGRCAAGNDPAPDLETTCRGEELPDYSDLIERLRELTRWGSRPDRLAAADALESLIRRVAELEHELSRYEHGLQAAGQPDLEIGSTFEQAPGR